MIKNCKQCSVKFEITQEDLDFYDKIEVPAPKQCPKCRLVRRLQERNARKLYVRKCNATGKKIISMYHENHEFPVYESRYWWSDNWDAMKYGKDFDFTKSFFEQYKNFKNKVPHFSVFVAGGTLENSEYTNCTGYLKNCYLISEADYDEDCLYSNRIYHSKNLIDCSNCDESEICYECSDCVNCNNLLYSQQCENCNDSYFLKSCIGCNNCIASSNQRNKQYMIFNKQYTKKEYEKKKKEFGFETSKKLAKFETEVLEFFKTQPRKAIEGKSNENVIGDHVYNSKNAYECYDSNGLEDCRYCVKIAGNVKNCFDYSSWGFKAELVYQSSACGDNAYNIKFCSNCTTNISNLEYCFQCTKSSNLFACVGLKNKKFCILNKQYSEKEYFVMREKIIKYMKQTGEWGEYFQIDSCPFGYNETIAMEIFPLSKEEALKKGYKWSDYEMPTSDIMKVIEANHLPSEISEIPDDVLNWAIKCEATNKPFKITKQELNFYRKFKIPCPRKCPDQRFLKRMNKRPSYLLKEINCSGCQKNIPCNGLRDKSESVLCEDCYLKEVY